MQKHFEINYLPLNISLTAPDRIGTGGITSFSWFNFERGDRTVLTSNR